VFKRYPGVLNKRGGAVSYIHARLEEIFALAEPYLASSGGRFRWSPSGSRGDLTMAGLIQPSELVDGRLRKFFVAHDP